MGNFRLIILVVIIALTTILIGYMATSIFAAEEMYLVRPLLASCAVFTIFCCVLMLRVRANIFGEVGFIYLTFALVYTILPGITFLQLDFFLPNATVIFPEPQEIGRHFWRHLIFISGVSVGYLIIRGGNVPLRHLNKISSSKNGQVITILFALIVCSILIVTLLSAPVTGYLDHYTRFDHLSWLLRRFVYVCLNFKYGSYFVIMALMFSQYRRYRKLIFFVVPIFCVYESIYSLGSRIQALIILLAFAGLFHFWVAPIRFKKGIIFLFILGIIFSGIEIFRSSDYSLDAAKDKIKSGIQVVEFGALFNTGFHLYTEREQRTLPPRHWKMFFYEFRALIPFIDHTTYHPQYWYARNYFPNAIVPPQTMGVIPDSAIWGGEFDLIMRSLINGAIFALLMRWFLQREEKWWAVIIYVYCYATCIMTLKYSILYQLIPLLHNILPPLMLTGFLFRLPKVKLIKRKGSVVKKS